MDRNSGRESFRNQQTERQVIESEEIVNKLADQTGELCHIHDHITRVIANLDVPHNWFSDYEDSNRAKFELEPVVLLFLYKRVRGFNQKELARRLKGAPYVYLRIGLSQPLSQQIISYTWRRRFTRKERQTIKAAAEAIRKVAIDHDVVTNHEPALDPEDIQGREIGEEQIMQAVRLASDYGFGAFTADRASNTTYSLNAYLERQGYLTMANAGTTTPRRRFARLSERDRVPHGSSHNRTVKKIADPDPQTDLNDYRDGRRPPDWERIRGEVLPAFHLGVDRLLEEITECDRDGLREPVKAAIDITPWPFYPSPYCNEEDAEKGKSAVVDGEKRYIREDHPEMVSGLNDDRERGYQFATLTIVAEDTPLVLAIEPVRDGRWWEEEDIKTTSRGQIVDRLLKQARQHVDIHKVFADRGFDTTEVRDVIDRHSVQYVIPKKMNANADYENIKNVKEHSVADVAVEPSKLIGEDGHTHDVSILYVPSSGEEGKYAIFTTNSEVSPDRAQGLTAQYQNRWEIENEYKTIKKHFLPTSASKDYRVRFLYFVIGVMMYNVWRLTNFRLRDEVAVDLGEEPPVRAGEIVELVAFCLFDPGD